MLPTSCTVAALEDVTVPVLFITAHAVRDVGAVTTAVNVPACASAPIGQFRTCVPTGPVTVQPAPEDSVHVTPPPAGSGSFSTTLLAVPGPPFVTRIVNVAVWPAVTVPPSGVLATVR